MVLGVLVGATTTSTNRTPVHGSLGWSKPNFIYKLWCQWAGFLCGCVRAVTTCKMANQYVMFKSEFYNNWRKLIRLRARLNAGGCACEVYMCSRHGVGYKGDSGSVYSTQVGRGVSLRGLTKNLEGKSFLALETAEQLEMASKCKKYL